MAFFRAGGLHDRHVADVCPHRGHRRCSTCQRTFAAHRAGNPNGIAAQIFGVVGASELPPVWAFAPIRCRCNCCWWWLVPGLLALVFGWLAFRSRVTGVYLSILTQAMTLALALWLFQNDSGLRGNNGLSGLQNIPGLDARAAGHRCRCGSSGPRRWRWGWAMCLRLG
jgi:ABC-type branched-subunit amino acid transport system permease subunit